MRHRGIKRLRELGVLHVVLRSLARGSRLQFRVCVVLKLWIVISLRVEKTGDTCTGELTTQRDSVVFIRVTRVNYFCCETVS